MKKAFSYLWQPMRQSFNYTGRVNRTQYWLFMLWEITIISAWVFLTVYTELTLREILGQQAVKSLSFSLSMPVILAFIPANIAIRCRRLHDIDLSGWWQLISLIPSLGWGIMLIFMLIPGTKGENTYGSVPQS